MSKNLGNSDVPTAARAGSSGWRDPRLWIGVALVAASILVGAKVLGGADDTVEVWAVRSDLAAGVDVTEGDLVRERVDLDEVKGRYLVAEDGLPDAANLLRPVGQGELLPRAALGEADDALGRLPLFLPGERVPEGLRRGDLIDVYVTPDGTAQGEKGEIGLALDDVVVLQMPKQDDALGASGNRQVVVGVGPDIDLAPVQKALETGRVQIVEWDA